MELVRKGRGVGTERSWSWFGKVVELVRIGRGVGTVTFPNQLDGHKRQLKRPFPLSHLVRVHRLDMELIHLF